MRRLCGALVCGAILLLATGATLRTVTLDECTVIAVEMMDKVDSTDARPGDFFRFETINAVTAGATIVIPARTMG